MAINIMAVKCPQCNADLQIPEGKMRVSCPYCGADVAAVNENEYIYRHIDEADVKRAETDFQFHMKQLEMEKLKQESAEREKQLRTKIYIILGAIALVGLGLGSAADIHAFNAIGCVSLVALVVYWKVNKAEKEEAGALDGVKKIRVPHAVSGYEDKSYTVIESIFTSAGFTNVRCIPLNDLTLGLLKKPGLVDSIVIDGHEITMGGRKFSPDAAVIISYHSLAGR